jgi:signal transduction histidine kinase
MKFRFRIALLIATSLLVAGSIAILITAVGYEKTAFESPGDVTEQILDEIGVDRDDALAYLREHPEAFFEYDPDAPVAADGRSVNEIFADLQEERQREAVRESRPASALAVGALAIVTGALGWLVAGRVLRPVRLITERARSAAELDLHSRVALSGPDDELRQLADTFDEMLGRIERSFLAQRRFSAQVSHELRTPLTVIRTESELLLANAVDPDDRRSVAAIHDAAVRAQRLISALLVLSRTESGHLDQVDVQLDELTGDVTGELLAPGGETPRLDLDLRPATVVGDRALLESMVTNLVANAMHHNVPGGWARIDVRPDGDTVVVEVVNSAEHRPAPHESASARSAAAGNGVGSTVIDAIVDAHGGTVERASRADGEYAVRVSFPRAIRPGAPKGPRVEATAVG